MVPFASLRKQFGACQAGGGAGRPRQQWWLQVTKIPGSKQQLRHTIGKPSERALYRYLLRFRAIICQPSRLTSGRTAVAPEPLCLQVTTTH
jgi:hypothetical protein